MTGTKTVLFLFGITIASCHVLRNGKLCKDEPQHSTGSAIIMKPSSLSEEMPAYLRLFASPPNMPSFIPPFVQQGTNFFYKPQFMQPGMIPSPITTFVEQKDCDNKKTEISEVVFPPKPLEVHVVEPVVIPEPQEDTGTVEPVVIPQPPELPPLKPEPVFIEVLPQHMPEVPEFKPFEIPEAPTLPPFTMSELPPIVIPAIPAISEAPTIPTFVVPEALLPVIPEAPSLSPFTMPELPAVVIPETQEIPEAPVVATVVIPEAPVLPPLTMPELPPVIIPPIPETSETTLHVIPEAPVLPPFTMTQLPEVVVPEKAECNETPKPVVFPEFSVLPEHPSNDIPVETALPELKPVVIPEAPVLPPFTNPELPVIEITPEVSSLDIQPQIMTEWIELSEKVKPIVIPEAPVLPPFEVPQYSTVIVPEPIEVSSPYQVEVIDEAQTPDFKPIEIPPAPQLPLFEMPSTPQIVLFDDVPKPTPIIEVPIVTEVTDNKLSIPEPPQLPPFNMVALPTYAPLVPVELLPAPRIAETYLPSIDVRVPEVKAVQIPEAPVLPRHPMAVIAEPIVVENAEEPCPEDKAPVPKRVQTLRIPELRIPSSDQQQFMFAAPTFYAQNIIIERILPNMILDCDKALSEGKYPVIPKAFFLPERN